MKFILLLFLATFAMGDHENCVELQTCFEMLVPAISGDTPEKEVCDDFSTGIDCIIENVDQCDIDVAIFDEGLAQIKDRFHDICGYDEDKTMQECFDENEEYIYECMYQIEAEQLYRWIRESVKLDEDTMTCTLYSLMADCSLNRFAETCGVEAAEAGREELYDLPKDIEEACDNAQDIDIPSFMFIEKKK